MKIADVLRKSFFFNKQDSDNKRYSMPSYSVLLLHISSPGKNDIYLHTILNVEPSGILSELSRQFFSTG